MVGRDRRRCPRFEGEFKAHVLNVGDDPIVSPIEDIIPAEALDVSKHGMRLRVFYNVPVGSLLSAILYYRGEDSVCLSRVVWKRPEGDAMCYGLFIKEWSKMNKELARALDAMEVGIGARATTTSR